MKKRPKKIKGNSIQISFAREVTYSGREMTDIKSFLGIWYWFYLLD